MKRLVDVVAGAVLLTITTPMMGLIAALVRVRLGRPMVFSQHRVGLNGQVFAIHKFRTMTLDDSGRVSDIDRLTRSRESGGGKPPAPGSRRPVRQRHRR